MIILSDANSKNSNFYIAIQEQKKMDFYFIKKTYIKAKIKTQFNILIFHKTQLIFKTSLNIVVTKTNLSQQYLIMFFFKKNYFYKIII